MLSYQKMSGSRLNCAKRFPYGVVLAVLFLWTAALGQPPGELSNDANTLALWHFNENSDTLAMDASGYSNTVHLRNGASWSDGRFGSGLYLSGGTAYVQNPHGYIAPNASLVLANQFSIELWFKAEEYGPQKPRLVCGVVPCSPDGIETFEMYLLNDSKKLTFRMRTVTMTDSIISTDTIALNTWYWVSATYNGTLMRLYIDTLLEGAKPLSGAVAPDTAGLGITIGRINRHDQVCTLQDYFKGTIDEVRISNVDRSIDRGLVAHFPYDGHPNDVSGNGYQGVLHGAVTPSADRFGLPERAYAFAQTSDINYGDILNDAFLTNTYSISLWYARTSENNGALISKWQGIDADHDNSFYLCQTGFCASGAKCSDVIERDPLNTWVHLVAQVETGRLRLYTNGQLTITDSTFSSQSSVRDLIVGNTQDRQDVYQTIGLIDDIRVYNRILTEDEVQVLFSGDIGQLCCGGSSGNADGDFGDVVDISDLSVMVDYLFFGGSISTCFEENDVNQDHAVDISDLQSVIDFLFFGASLPDCA